MASIKPHRGKWRAFVFKLGIRKSQVFQAKAQATAWAAQTEADIISGKSGNIPNKRVSDLFSRYAEEVAVTKRGARWEIIRLKLLSTHALAKIHLSQLTQPDIAKWRDNRLKQVSHASVNREMNLLSNVFTIAVNEWKWLKEHPMKGVRRPPPSRPRDRLIPQDEIDRLTLVLGDDVNTVSGRVGLAFLFAIETAMRAGEIAGLKPVEVHLDKSYCHVSGGKTNSARRDVPLSHKAIEILKKLGKDLFNLKPSQIDATFRKAKKQAMVEGLHFHDTRAEAITRLAAKLDILELARMVGHKDLRQLQVYYRKSAQDIAGKL